MVFSKLVDLKLQSTTIIGFGFRLIARIVNASVYVIPTLAILLNFIQELLSSDHNNCKNCSDNALLYREKITSLVIVRPVEGKNYHTTSIFPGSVSGS